MKNIKIQLSTINYEILNRRIYLNNFMKNTYADQKDLFIENYSTLCERLLLAWKIVSSFCQRTIRSSFD